MDGWMDEWIHGIPLWIKWGISEANNKYSYYLNFVKIVSNLTYKNLHLLNGFQNDETLINTDWIQLIEAVHPQLDGALLTFENKIKPEWQFVITELGLCFTLNSRFAKLMVPNSTFTSIVSSDTWKNKRGNLKCHYLNGLCYARYDSDPNRPIWNCRNRSSLVFLSPKPYLLRKVIGKYGFGERHATVKRLLQFYPENNFSITNTGYEHHARRQYT
ncbi:hypothetical protein HUJ05_001710 [Dendroctonus ponderosae]|nr:hypothetical protein HUJ05_001710 [Dendroctonus ponderosae]